MSSAQYAASEPRAPHPGAVAPHIEDFIAFRVSVLAHLMGRIVALTYGREFGISLRQWRVLAFVGRYGRLSGQEVARRSPLDKSQVSRAVSELIERGSLRSVETAGDRRRKQLVLTAAGRRLHAQLVALGRVRNARYARALTDAERLVFEGGLKKLTEEARRITKELEAAGRKQPRLRSAS